MSRAAKVAQEPNRRASQPVKRHVALHRQGEPYAHAADLPAAYRELEEALRATAGIEVGLPPGARAIGIPSIGLPVLWKRADEAAEAFQRVAAAARRVKVALVGKRDAAQWDGFKRSANPRA